MSNYSSSSSSSRVSVSVSVSVTLTNLSPERPCGSTHTTRHISYPTHVPVGQHTLHVISHILHLPILRLLVPVGQHTVDGLQL